MRAWAAGALALVLGLCLPLAPSTHVAFAEATAHRVHDDGGHGGEPGVDESGSDAGHTHAPGPAHPHKHKGSECKTCAQLAAMARAGVVALGADAPALGIVARPALSLTAARPWTRQALFEARPRAPPAAAARAA